MQNISMPKRSYVAELCHLLTTGVFSNEDVYDIGAPELDSEISLGRPPVLSEHRLRKTGLACQATPAKSQT